MLNKNLVIFLSLMIIGFTVGCSNDELNTDDGAAIKVKGKKVVTTKMGEEFTFSGNVVGDRKVNISTKLMGKITSLKVKAGDKVNKGQLLVKIDNDNLKAKQAQVKAGFVEAEAAYNNVEKNYNRIKVLYDKESATQKEMDDISAAYTMAKAKLNSVKEMKKEVEDILSYSELKSPFNGYVVNKFVQTGDMASPGMPLLTVEDLKSIKVVANVPESEIYLLKENDEVIVNIDAIKGKVYKGIINQINPGGNPASRQYEIQVSIKDVDDKIKSGMYAKIILKKGFKKVLTVPENWLVKRGQLVGLFTTSTNNELMLRWVRTGTVYNNEIEIISGLKEGETIITPDEKLKEGIKVEVIK